MKILVVIVLALLLLLLVKRNLLQVDLSFPWFLALAILGFASTSEGFINWIAAQLDIVYKPLAVILIAIFIIVGISVFLAMTVSKLRHRQLMIVRHLAQAELARQEQERRGRTHAPAGERSPRG